jgi:hypothetical protein
MIYVRRLSLQDLRLWREFFKCIIFAHLTNINYSIIEGVRELTFGKWASIIDDPRYRKEVRLNVLSLNVY